MTTFLIINLKYLYILKHNIVSVKQNTPILVDDLMR